jgi:hypothetical protein
MVVQAPSTPTQANSRMERHRRVRVRSRSMVTVRTSPSRNAPEVLMTNVDAGKWPGSIGHASCTS